MKWITEKKGSSPRPTFKALKESQNAKIEHWMERSKFLSLLSQKTHVNINVRETRDNSTCFSAGSVDKYREDKTEKQHQHKEAGVATVVCNTFLKYF